MPPGQKLPAESIAAVRRWIELGAPWVDEAPATADWKLAPADVWEFQPLSHPSVPAGSGSAVDAFIAAKLREKKLTPAPRTDRATLLRRATFDLTGLAPTPENAEFRARSGARFPGFPQGGGAAAGVAALWRALGTALAGRGPLCRFRRLLQRFRTSRMPGAIAIT